MSYYYSYYWDSPYYYSRYYDLPSYRYSSLYDWPYYSRYYDWPSYRYPYYSRYYDYPYYSSPYYSRYWDYPYYSRYYPYSPLPTTKSVSYETVKRETVYSPYTGTRTYTTVL